MSLTSAAKRSLVHQTDFTGKGRWKEGDARHDAIPGVFR